MVELSDVNRMLADAGVDRVAEAVERLDTLLHDLTDAMGQMVPSTDNVPPDLQGLCERCRQLNEHVWQLKIAKSIGNQAWAERTAQTVVAQYADLVDLTKALDGFTLPVVGDLNQRVLAVFDPVKVEGLADASAELSAASAELPQVAAETAAAADDLRSATEEAPQVKRLTPPGPASTVADAYGAAGQVVVNTVEGLRSMVTELADVLARSALARGDARAEGDLTEIGARMANLGKMRVDALSVDTLFAYARRSATAAATVARFAATAGETDAVAMEYMNRIKRLREQMELSDRMLRAGNTTYVEVGSKDANVVTRSIDALVKQYRVAGETLTKVMSEHGTTVAQRVQRLEGDARRLLAKRQQVATSPMAEELRTRMDAVDQEAAEGPSGMARRLLGLGAPTEPLRPALAVHRRYEQAVADAPRLDYDDPYTWRAAVRHDGMLVATGARSTLSVARRLAGGPRPRTDRQKALVSTVKADVEQQLRAVVSAINAHMLIDDNGDALRDLMNIREELLDTRNALEQANRDDVVKRSVDFALGGASMFTGFLTGVLGVMGVHSLLDVASYISGGFNRSVKFGEAYYRATLAERGVGAQYNRARTREMLNFGRELFARTNGMVDPTKPLEMRGALLRGVGGRRGQTPDQAAADADVLTRRLFAFAEVEDIDQGTLNEFVKTLYKDADRAPDEVVRTVRQMTETAKRAGIPTKQFMKLTTQLVDKMRTLGVSADVAVGTMDAMVDRGMRVEDAVAIVEHTAQVQNNVFQPNTIAGATASVVFGHMAGFNPGNPWGNILMGFMSHDSKGDPIKNRYQALGKMLRTKYNFLLTSVGTDAAGYANLAQQLMKDGYTQKQAAQITNMFMNGDDEALGELLEGIDVTEQDDREALTGTAEAFTERLAKASEQLGFAQKIEADRQEFMQWVADLVTNDLAPMFNNVSDLFEKLITKYLVPTIEEGLAQAKKAYEGFKEFLETPLGSTLANNPGKVALGAGGLLFAGGAGAAALKRALGRGAAAKLGGRAGAALGIAALGGAAYALLGSGEAEAAERQAEASERAATGADLDAAAAEGERTAAQRRASWAKVAGMLETGQAKLRVTNLDEAAAKSLRTDSAEPAAAGQPSSALTTAGYAPRAARTLAAVSAPTEADWGMPAAVTGLSALGALALTGAGGGAGAQAPRGGGGRAALAAALLAGGAALYADAPSGRAPRVGDVGGSELAAGAVGAALALALARRGQGGAARQVAAALLGGTFGAALTVSAQNFLGLSRRDREVYNNYMAKLRELDEKYMINVGELVDAESDEGDAVRRIFNENEVDYADLTTAQKANVQMMFELLAKGLLNYRQLSVLLKQVAAQEGGTVNADGQDVELSDEVKQELYTQASEQILGGNDVYDVSYYRMITAQAAYNKLANKKLRDADDERWMRMYAFTVDYYKQRLGKRDDGSPYTHADYMADIKKQAEYDVEAGWRPDNNWRPDDEQTVLDKVKAEEDQRVREILEEENGSTTTGDDPEALGSGGVNREALVALRMRELEQEKATIATSDEMLQVLRQKRYENRRVEYANEHPKEVKPKGTTNPELGKGKGALAAVPYKEWYDEIMKRAAQYGVDPKLMAAIMYTESHFDPNARSGVGAIGLAQFMPDTARSIGFSPEEMYDPLKAIHANAMHLRALQDTFGNDYRLIAAAYNAGAGAVKNAGGIPPYRETQDYVRKVLAAYGGDVPQVSVPPGSSPFGGGAGAPASVDTPTQTTLADAMAATRTAIDRLGGRKVTGTLVDNLWVIPEGQTEVLRPRLTPPASIAAADMSGTAQQWRAQNERAMRAVEQGQREDNRRLSRSVDIEQAARTEMQRAAAEREAKRAADDLAREQAQEAEDARTVMLTINGRLREGFTNADLEAAINDVLTKTAMEIETEYATIAGGE